ncbi:hypothetical protein EMCRGX_G007536 [Ephydatia muelleri]
MPLHVMADFGGFLCYISPINLLKASLDTRPILLSQVVRGDHCLKDYGFRLSQARVDSAEVSTQWLCYLHFAFLQRFYSNWSKTKTTTAPTCPSLEVTLKMFYNQADAKGGEGEDCFTK